ncbi:LPXTG cell wall anchor domain-containing protein [Enterococcus sp. AZ192]|uniref:LPXTG cell wall anchor domain-containing protein n=1 Tax=unclassified Enterococcus TaxID=2608891 RepID=UPI003D268968
MKNLKSLVLFSIACVSIFTIHPISVQAEGEGNGGGIQTNGEIGFYEETKPTTEPTTEPTTSDSTPTVKKPVGRYPSTGELVKKSLSISGAALVVIAAIAFFWKRKKDDDEQKEGS